MRSNDSPLSSPRRRGPIRRSKAMWQGQRHIETLVVMGPRLRGDDSGEATYWAARDFLLSKY